jgi:hypothetical protein
MLKWIGLAVFTVFVLGLFTLLLGTDYLSNSRSLRRMEASLSALSLPPHTEMIANHSGFGILSGNGNHCDFFVGASFRSTASPDAIREHYARLTFQNPVTFKQEAYQLSIIESAQSFSSSVGWFPDSMDRPEAWGISSQDFSSGTVFIVSIHRSYEANNDCRCH